MIQILASAATSFRRISPFKKMKEKLEKRTEMRGFHQ
jgi:hypothetical protein